MWDKWERLEIQIQLARQKQKAAARKHGIGPQPPDGPGAGDESEFFWRLVAGLGCELVVRGYRLRGQRWPQPSPLGGLLIRAGQRLRRRALVVAKSARCG